MELNYELTDADIAKFREEIKELFDNNILNRISDIYSTRDQAAHEYSLYRKKNVSKFLRSRPSKTLGDDVNWDDLTDQEKEAWKSVWGSNIRKYGVMIKELAGEYEKQLEEVGEGKMKNALIETVNTLYDDYDTFLGHIIEPEKYKFDESTKSLKNIIKESFKSIFKEAYPEEAKLVAVNAIDNTDSEYMKKSLEQRNPSSQSAGSTFLTPISVDDLKIADWKPYNHPNITSPAIAYKADIPGKLGIAELKLLPSDLRVRFQPAHKGASMGVEVVAEIPQRSLVVDHTTLILGPSKDNPNKLVVWTFFPGDPTSQSEPIMMDKVREVVGGEGDFAYGTVADAINIGFNFAKNGAI